MKRYANGIEKLVPPKANFKVKKASLNCGICGKVCCGLDGIKRHYKKDHAKSKYIDTHITTPVDAKATNDALKGG